MNTLPGLDLVDMKRFAIRADLSYETIRTYRSEGKLPKPTAFYGSSPVWAVSVVDAWIAEREIIVEEVTEAVEIP